MTNRGKFKFESASKRARSLRASAFSDIGTIVRTDGPIEERRFFIQNLRNTLRCKDLIKHKQSLKEILNKCPVLSDGAFTDEFPFTSWSILAVGNLLQCARSASSLELTHLCKLLAIFFKDYGDQDCVVVPFTGLLEVLERSPENSAEAIFSFISSHFRINSRCISDGLEELLLEFTPWLCHRHNLLRRLSMESLSLLLRRLPDAKLRDILCDLLCMDDSEHLLLGIIKNVNGTFTTKLHPIFKFLLLSISSDTFQPPQNINVVDARNKISTAMRRCMAMMSKHCKGGKLNLDWLEPVYEDFVARYSDDTLSTTAVSAYSIAAELSVELLFRFRENNRLKVKQLTLVRSGPSFDAFLSHYVLPLLAFAKERGAAGAILFDELCQLLVRVVRSNSEATVVLRDRFREVLDDLLCFVDDTTNISPMMVLFEWRLRSDDFVHISHFLLLISRLFDSREVFHPFIVNPAVNTKIWSCIENSVDAIASLGQTRIEEDDNAHHEWQSRFDLALSVIFGCLKGLRSISSLRSKMKLEPIDINNDLLQQVLRECLESLKSARSSRLAVEVYLQSCSFLAPEHSAVWVQSLVDAAKLNAALLLNHRMLEEFSMCFNESMQQLLEGIVSLLPSANADFRRASLKFCGAYYTSSGIGVDSLMPLLDMESLEASLEHERRKSLLITKSVESLDLSGNTTAAHEQLIYIIFLILLSQYNVKFAPMWQAASESLDRLMARLATAFTGKRSVTLNSLLARMWHACLTVIEKLGVDQPVMPVTCPSFVIPFLGSDDHKSTDHVIMQREVLRVMTTIVSHIGQKEAYIKILCSYAHAQMIDEAKVTFRKNALATLSTLLSKYNLRETPVDIVDVCIRDGIRSPDASVREYSLLIVYTAYPGLNIKRLQDLATGSEEHLSVVDGSSSSANLKDAKMRELSFGIEIRMLCPRILQHSKQLHGKNIFEYLSTLESRYLGLLLAELMPQCFRGMFCSVADASLDAFSWMVEVMRFNSDSGVNIPLQRAIRTVGVMVTRLKKNLEVHAMALFECCSCILTACAGAYSDKPKPEVAYLVGCNVDSLVANTITLMVDVMNIFDGMLPSFIQVLANHSYSIGALLEKNKEVMSLIQCLTTRPEYVENVCTLVLGDTFSRIFKQPTTPQLVGILENVYCKRASLLDSNLPSSDNMAPLLVSVSGDVLSCISNYKPTAVHIIKAILQLPVDTSQRHMCLNIVLEHLPNLKAMSLHNSTKETPDYERMRYLRRTLECIELGVSLLDAENVALINTIWDFVNDCLFFIRDLESRRLACLVLSRLPVTDSGLQQVCAHMLSMNASTAGSMDAKMDFDANCDHLSLLVKDFVEQQPSPKVLFSVLSHALFVLLSGHKDPSVRRCVLQFTLSVMTVISRSMSNMPMSEPLDEVTISSSCEYMETSSTPQIALLLKGIFPFIQMCLSGLHLRESLFSFSIELLEQYAKKFSDDVRLSSVFSGILHGDLLCNNGVVECLAKLRDVHKYSRNDGLKQLCTLISQGVFSPLTIYRLIVPICLQFLLQSQSPRYTLFCDTSRDCLISCGNKLAGSVLIKFLRRLVDAYERHQITTALHIFSAVVCNIPTASDSETSSLLSADEGSNERCMRLLQKFRRMLMQSQPSGEDIPCVDAYEALGSLLRHHSAEVRQTEVIKHSRVICKALCSRAREVRRYGRLSLIRFLQRMGFSYFPTVLQELAANLTRGYQLQILIFTTHSILSSFLKSDPSLTVSSEDGLQTMLHMITTELVTKYETEDIASKIDEARHPKAASLLELLSEFGDLEVCLGICCYIWSLLKGTCKMPPGSCFDYSNKLIQSVDHLLTSSIRGCMANTRVDLNCFANALFYGHIWLVRGMSTRMKKQLPPNVCSQYAAFKGLAAVALKCDGPRSNASISDGDTSRDAMSGVSKTKEDHYTLHPGASTGRPLVTHKKLGFDDHLVSPLFVNAALRLYSHILSSPENPFTTQSPSHVDNCLEPDVTTACDLSASQVPSMTTAFGILLCFVCDDVKLQRASAACLSYLCENNPSFMGMCGSILADHLVHSLGAMQLVGSADLAKDHLRLTCQFLRSKSNNILFNAWKKSGKPTELISGLLLQIEANLDRPALQVALLKLFTQLLQMEAASSHRDRTLYEVFQEVFVRMLKGALTPSAMRVSSRAVAQFLVVVPMEESNRSKRFGMLLKHVKSSISLVRLTVLQCLHHVLKGISKKGSWKRYCEMVAVSIAMQLLSEGDLQCKRVMATIICFLWSESPADLKKDLLECVAHFLGKVGGCKEEAFAYFSFHCLSTESSMSWIRKYRISEKLIAFTTGLDGETPRSPPGTSWQVPYYWLRVLSHLLGIDRQFDFISLEKSMSADQDPTSVLMHKVWRYAVTTGVSSSHPWIRAASLRVLAMVLSNPSAYDTFCENTKLEIYALARPCLKLLSTGTGMVERHEKVATALQDCLTGLMDNMLRLSQRADKNIPRFVSKTCYYLRLALGKARHCPRRLDQLLQLLHRYASDSRAFDEFLRPTILRVMIAVSRAVSCNFFLARATSQMSPPSEEISERKLCVADIAHAIISTIETGFTVRNEVDEYLKLLCFARDFVSRQKMLKRAKIQSNRPAKRLSDLKRKKRKTSTRNK
ncbi:HEAT repeat containing protein [Babesia caballi]|uniref:HEAT repeat containing protein n=1 Tax=Babesia caballi TaxID=5871 RepID=A0AAV4LWA8_BABCB|nr:HEAT repeat containing protein [Babesia caballi]